MLSIIVAMTEDRVIGRDGDLPWRLPEDLKRFKRLTSGHAVIMGRRTYESIPAALPQRRMIVLTRDADAFARLHPEAPVETVAGLDEALELVVDDDEPFVIGGAAVYALALPRADRMHLTLVHAAVDGDVRFPEFDSEAWRLVDREPHPADDRHPHPFTFMTYERVRAPD